MQIEDLRDPNDPGYTLTGLVEGKGYFFAVTAYDDEGFESEYSNEAATCSVAAPIVTGENLQMTSPAPGPGVLERRKEWYGSLKVGSQRHRLWCYGNYGYFLYA